MTEPINRNYLKTIRTLAWVSVLLFAGALSVGNIFLPFASATCAALFLLENPKKRIASFIVPISLCLLEVVFSLIGYPYLFFAGYCIFPSCFLALAFHRRWNRRDATFFVVPLIALLIAFSLYLSVALQNGVFGVGAVMDWYRAQFDAQKADTIAMVQETAFPSFYDPSMVDTVRTNAISNIEVLFNAAQSLIFAWIFWLAMIFFFIAVKVFSRIVKKITKIERHAFFTDFLVTSPTAYVFLILAAISVFLPDTAQTAVLILRNLYFLLMLPFFYIGCKAFRIVVKRSDRRSLLIISAVLTIVIFNFYAVVLFALFGACSNILFNRSEKTFHKDSDSH